MSNDSEGRNNHERVSLINTALKARGINTWFDSDRMFGINEKMINGIENTKCMIVFTTQIYIDKVKLPSTINDNAAKGEAKGENHQF